MLDPNSTQALQNNPIWTAPSDPIKMKFLFPPSGGSENLKTIDKINTLNGAPGVNIIGFQILSEACVGEDQDKTPGEKSSGKAYFMSTLRFSINNAGGFNIRHKDKEYGIYMTDVKVEIHSLTDGVSLLDSQPTTFEGSTTEGSNSGGSVGGNIGMFGKSGQGTGSANWSWSQSYSRNIPDVEVTGTGTDNNPSWDFQVENLPRIHGSTGVDRKITDPPNVAIGKFDVLLFWSWAIPYDIFKKRENKKLIFYVKITPSYGYRHIKHNKDHENIVVSSIPMFVGEKGFDYLVRSEDNFFTMNRPEEMYEKPANN